MPGIVPIMMPEPGTRLFRFVGDRILFTMQDASNGSRRGWKAFLRTNLGRASRLRREIIEAHTRGLPQAGGSWRDLAMTPTPSGWELAVPLAEAGFFKAKAYVSDARGWQQWPSGADVAISVHPDSCRSGNTIYCAFTRMFGASKSLTATPQPDAEIQRLDQAGFTVIPPSGKLRDLKAALPHIVDVLGCRILHLLPIHPTPTTYARFGRFGSPYAALDLTAIDPALVEFDRRTTGIDQFCELTYATHLRGARVFLDIVINHTGWGSVLQENRPEWFLRDPAGTFISPGAWGTTWEDLVELKHRHVALWDELSETFLTWCRRGVDGFRCDAGYKVPTVAWEYITARVREEFPDTVFLLEGLGGAWETTETLLQEGGMQWAYSELFQNYTAQELSSYLDHTLRQVGRSGLLVHYSETHDNERLAAKGRAWSLLRNRVCALASVSGGFGFTCGVEWLAQERIKVHESRGMAWGAEDNIVPELAKLNTLLLHHPCFFDGARITRVSAPDSVVLALNRVSADAKDQVLVLVNTDPAKKAVLELDAASFPALNTWADLLGQAAPHMSAKAAPGKWRIQLPAAAAHCLSPRTEPLDAHGGLYRQARARAAWALQAICRVLSVEQVGDLSWQFLAETVERSPALFLSAVARAADWMLKEEADGKRFLLDQRVLSNALAEAEVTRSYSRVIRWSLPDARRIVPVPPAHWLLVEDTVPFRARLSLSSESTPVNVISVPVAGGHVACISPRRSRAEATLTLERYNEQDREVAGNVRFLDAGPVQVPSPRVGAELRPEDIVLLTNGRGGMARMCIDLGRVTSKYDCVLAANLHPSVPVDRHVLVKRIRLWVNADGFLSPLDYRSLACFSAGPPAAWSFVANAGDGRTVQIGVSASMLAGVNTVLFRFTRPSAEEASGIQLPPNASVSLTVRLDIEDRSFHWETKRNGGAEHHFRSHTHTLEGAQGPGFEFTPAPDRQLRVIASSGSYHAQPEWSDNLPHPVEQSRGLEGSGDAYSPGWFELPLPKGADISLSICAEPGSTKTPVEASATQSGSGETFAEQLVRATRQFLVRRGEGVTVIAGYPWFLDWGRDTFICARGLIAAGLVEEVRQIVMTFAAFEDQGTLPNIIHGEDASNRDTSDAPLWFGLVCAELVGAGDADLYRRRVGKGSRTLAEVLHSIATHYARGTPNGIRMDPASALIWSPRHFTWMDTNYPACTPRQGYPIEIQALWVRLLEQLAQVPATGGALDYAALARRAREHVAKLFWREQEGYFSDVLLAEPGQPAAAALADDALRSNCLLAVSLGVVGGERTRRCVEAARRWLVVPGALRSLAPLPVKVPLPNVGNQGQVLNDPLRPYWGHYEGDEDTRRKPAYHNGTAWTWTLPVFCEALARAWEMSPEAVSAARAYLASMQHLMGRGCLGHIPEIVDGDAPHQHRGCDAQAWGATEALRVLKLLT